MTLKKTGQKRALGQLMTAVGFFLFAGVIMLLHVWLPVQARRELGELRRLRNAVSQRKNILEKLQNQYRQSVSLPFLDRWACKNGAWRVPREEEIVTFYE